MTKIFDFAQAANSGVTILPDLTLGIPSVGDVLSVTATTGGIVSTRFLPSTGGSGGGAGYLALSGGTMTGPLTLAGDPTATNQAATKHYVDLLNTTITGGFLPLSGGTLTGPLALAADPTANAQAATKLYVDTQVGTVSGLATGAVQKAGSTMTGLLILSADPSSTNGAATKHYVDVQTAAAGIPDAPLTGVTFGRQSAAWVGVLPLAGGTLTGPLLLNAAPSAPLGAATKAYVDANTFSDAPSDTLYYGRHTGAWASVAPLASPAFTGVPTAPVAAADTSTTQLATTQFVLGQAANATPLIEGTAAIGSSNRYARQDHVHPAAASRNTARLQAQWVTGAIVANDTVYLAYDAPYAGTVNSLTYFTGAGSFSVAIQINGTNDTSLSAVAVTSSTPATTAATGANTFSLGARITAVITGATGSPVDALLSLAVTWS